MPYAARRTAPKRLERTDAQPQPHPSARLGRSRLCAAGFALLRCRMQPPLPLGTRACRCGPSRIKRCAVITANSASLYLADSASCESL
jgi:hypothetical protein